MSMCRCVDVRVTFIFSTVRLLQSGGRWIAVRGKVCCSSNENQKFRIGLHVDSINQFVQSPLFSKIATPVCALIMILLFWWRAGSIHSVFDRIWRLTAGKTDAEDPTLKAFFQRNRELEKFRFVYRLNAQSIDQIKRLDRWLQENSVDISRLQSIRRWVDLGKDDLLSKPPTGYIWAKGITFLSAMLLFWGISILNPSHNAYLQMRESGIWFRTDFREFQAPLGAWKFSAEDCKDSQDDILMKTEFNKHEVSVICDGIADGSLKKFVTESLKTQTWLAAIFAAILMLTGISNVLALKSAADARELIVRLNKKAQALNMVRNDEQADAGTDAHGSVALESTTA